MQPKATSEKHDIDMEFPHRRMEGWKWTDVRGKITEGQKGLTLLATPKFSVPSQAHVAHLSNAHSHEHAMAALATRFAGDVLTIEIPAGMDAKTPVEINDISDGHTRIHIKLGKGAKLCVIETYKSEAAGFANTEICFDVGEGAELTRTIFHDDHAETVRVVTAHISAWKNASITQHALSFGGALSRIETRIAALGEGLKASVHGAYLLSGKRHCDMTSYIDLGALSAHIRQSVKGVISGKARGVFQGKFHVRRPAQFTDAEMRHDAIMLSDTCEVRSKPELEIYADDVACAHGNTVGALDESALFYMRQRGITQKGAKALLTEAFVAQAFDDMKDSADFMAHILQWLERH